METVPKKLGRVFNGILPNGAAGDGLIEVGLGLKQIDLAIIRQVKRKYPVTVTVGLDVSFVADDGSVLFTKKLQSSSSGEVEVTDQSCQVKGLDTVVREAVDLVSEGVARQIGESVRVKEFAGQRKGGQSPAPLSSQPTGMSSAAPESSPSNAAPTAPPQPSVVVPLAVATDRSPEGTALIFRAIVRDENRDHLVQQEESLTIEIEVKNDGGVTAKDVEVVVTGTPALTAQFPPVLSIGDLSPGEVKRSITTKRMAIANEPLHGELVLSLRSTTPIASGPLAKKFTVVMKPEGASVAEAVPDVDQPPKPVATLKSQKAVIIAIGIGRFRDAQVPPVKFARHDAEVMASYLARCRQRPGRPGAGPAR